MTMTSKTLTEPQIATVAEHVLQGLSYMEQNKKIHRDIKPHNILLNTKGEAKLADFGISRDMEGAVLRRTVIGTPYYLAPEVIKESGYDGRADVWALGISCIEMAEKDPPYADVHPMRVLFLVANNPAPKLTHPELWSSEFNDFVTKCLEVDPMKRPQPSQLLKHPFLRGASPAELAPLIQLAQQFVDQHGGLEKALAVLKPKPEESDVAPDDENKDFPLGSDMSQGSDSFSLSEKQTNYLAESSDDEMDVSFGGSDTEGSDSDAGGKRPKGAEVDDFDIDDFMSDLEKDTKPISKPTQPEKKLERATSRPKIPRALSVERSKDDVVWDTLRGGLVADKERVNPKASKATEAAQLESSAVDWAAVVTDSATDPEVVVAPMSSPRLVKKSSVKQIDWTAAMKEFEVAPPARPVSLNPSSGLLKPATPQRPRSTSQVQFDDLLAELDTIQTPAALPKAFRNVAALAFAKQFPNSETAVARGSWTGVVTGENPFRNNPQFVLALADPSQCLVTVKTDVAGVRVRFVVLQVRDAQFRLPSIPSYGVHTEVPYSNDLEVSIPTLFDDASMKYIVIPCIESLSHGKTVSFELRVSATTKPTIRPLPAMSEILRVGEWTKDTAGGCINHASWRRNPQFALRLSTTADVHLFITQHSTPLQFIGFYLVKTDTPSQTLMKISHSRILNSDIKFRKRAEIYSGRMSLNAGNYILIVATFEPNVIGRFSVALLTDNSAVNLTPLVGLNLVSVTDSWTVDSAGGCLNSPTWIKNPKALLTVRKACTATLVLTRHKDAKPATEIPFIGFYVFKSDRGGVSSLRKVDVVCKTKNFVDAVEVMESVALVPGTYVVVPCTFHAQVQGRFSFSVYGDGGLSLETLLSQSTRVKDSWRAANSGGSFQYSSWRANPQFLVNLDDDSSFSFSLGQERLQNGTFPLAGLVVAQTPKGAAFSNVFSILISNRCPRFQGRESLAPCCRRRLREYQVFRRCRRLFQVLFFFARRVCHCHSHDIPSFCGEFI